MKMYGDLKTAAERMLPGVITQAGFLGHDTRPLVDIIQQDEEAFRRLKLEWEIVAARLRYFQQQGTAGLGEPVTIEGKWVVQSYEVRGQLPCPYGDTLTGKETTSLRLAGAEEGITFSESSLHLLTAHHFLQGQGSPFRLEPDVLHTLLAE